MTTFDDVAKRSQRPRLKLDPLVILGLVPAAIVIGLLGVIAYRSLNADGGAAGLSLDNFRESFSDPLTVASMRNTVLFAFTALVTSLLIGIPASWLVERCDLRARNLVFVLMVICLLLPGYFSAIGWVNLFHRDFGLVNRWMESLFSTSTPLFNIESVFGMGFLQGFNLAPVVFVLTAASFRAMDPTLEESAQMGGASFVKVIRRITLPLASPSLLAAALYVFTIGLAAFDIPAIIGIPNRTYTFSTFLWWQIYGSYGPPRYGLVSAFAVAMIAVSLMLSWVYIRVIKKARKFEVVSGKGYRPKRVKLKRGTAVSAWLFLGAYFALSFLLPLLTILWVSLLPFVRTPSAEAFAMVDLDAYRDLPWDAVLRGLRHTLLLAVLAPTIAIFFSVVLSWVTIRSKYRRKYFFEYIAFLPHAVPNITFALAALAISLALPSRPIDLYGSIWLLLIVFCVVHLGFGTRMTNSGLIQIGRDLEESATVLGASRTAVFRRILVPILKPTLLYAWVWLAILTFRDLSLPAVLNSGDSVTLSMITYQLWSGGETAQAAALTLITMAGLLPLFLAYWLLGDLGGRSRRGSKSSDSSTATLERSVHA